MFNSLSDAYINTEISNLSLQKPNPAVITRMIPTTPERRDKTSIILAYPLASKPSSGQLRLQNAFPVRIGKVNSKVSVSSSKRSRSKPQESGYSPVASFAEISRLSSLNDEQKRIVAALKGEIKTLKIVR